MTKLIKLCLGWRQYLCQYFRSFNLAPASIYPVWKEPQFMPQPLPSTWFPNLTLRDLKKYKTLRLALERVLLRWSRLHIGWKCLSFREDGNHVVVSRICKPAGRSLESFPPRLFLCSTVCTQHLVNLLDESL